MRKQTLFPALFLVAEAVLYYLLLTTDGTMQVVSMFLAVVLCFLFAGLNTRRSNALRTVALGFTVCADWCLVVCSPIRQLAGMLFFLCTQTLYAVYLFSKGKHKSFIWLRVLLIAAVEATAYFVLGNKLDPLAAVSVCYYALLVVNILDAFSQRKRDILFPIALVLFLLCDTVVGLQAAAGVYLPISEGSWLYRLLHPGFNLAWVFYLPSQVLIAMSQRRKR